MIEFIEVNQQTRSKIVSHMQWSALAAPSCLTDLYIYTCTRLRAEPSPMVLWYDYSEAAGTSFFPLLSLSLPLSFRNVPFIGSQILTSHLTFADRQPRTWRRLPRMSRPLRVFPSPSFRSKYIHNLLAYKCPVLF